MSIKATQIGRYAERDRSRELTKNKATRQAKIRNIERLHDLGLTDPEIASALDLTITYVHGKLGMYEGRTRHDLEDASLRAAHTYTECEQWARKLLSGRPGVHFVDLSSTSVKEHVRQLVGVIDSLLDEEADLRQMRDWLSGKGGAA